jgi:hypothetical protein
MRRRLEQVTAIIAAAFFGLPGLWAYLGPESFTEHVATFPPFSRHLVHDMGAFMVAIAVVMIAALFWTDALSAAFLGAATGATLSGIAHIIDTHLGGRKIVDPVSLFGMAALLVIALVVRRRALASASGRTSDSP